MLSLCIGVTTIQWLLFDKNLKHIEAFPCRHFVQVFESVQSSGAFPSIYVHHFHDLVINCQDIMANTHVQPGEGMIEKNTLSTSSQIFFGFASAVATRQSWRCILEKIWQAVKFLPKRASERSKQTNVQLAHDMKNTINTCFSFTKKSFAW